MFGVLQRGTKNAFRNVTRTFAVVLILAISIGLSLVMFLSYTTVQDKITSVKNSIGNVITLTPAGINGFQGGGTPLSNEQITEVGTLAHVKSVVSSIEDRLSSANGNTSLVSAIDPGSFGNRQGSFNRSAFGATPPTGGRGNNNSTGNTTFTVPITVTGTSSADIFTTNGGKLTAGKSFDPSSQNDEAVVGTALATKNKLVVGSTFTAYSTKITVDGIYDSGNTFTNAGLYMPLKTLQMLSSQADQVTSATITVDSITNMNSVVSAIKSKLGAGNVDVTSSQDAAQQALSPLENIESISLYSLIGALVAGSIITLLTMIMIVRERRREIGILKAIGASNIAIVTQFTTESLVLTLLGAVVGMVLGVFLSDPILNTLITNASTTTTSTSTGAAGGFGGGARRFGQAFGGGIRSSLTSLHTSVGYSIILYGLGVAIIIAVIGSALPSLLIAKVKPAEVLRSE